MFTTNHFIIVSQFVCLSAGCLLMFKTIEEYQSHIKIHLSGGLIDTEETSTNVPTITTTIATTTISTAVTSTSTHSNEKRTASLCSTATNDTIASLHNIQGRDEDPFEGEDEMSGSQRSSIRKITSGLSLSPPVATLSASSSSASASSSLIISTTTVNPRSSEVSLSSDLCLPCSQIVIPTIGEPTATDIALSIEASTLNTDTVSYEISPSKSSPKSRKRERLEKGKITRKLRNAELECPSMVSVISEKQMRVNSHNSTVYPFLNRGRKKRERDDKDDNSGEDEGEDQYLEVPGSFTILLHNSN